MAEATSEKLVGTIGIRVSDTTDRELDTLIEKLEDVNAVADTLVKKTLTLDIKTDTIESKIASVSKGLNKELREQLVGGFRTALEEMKTSLKEADASFKVSFDVAEFSAQLTQAVTAAASTFSSSIANDLQAAVAQLRQSGTATITVTSQTEQSAGGSQQRNTAAGTGTSRELARTYSQITASIREEYRIMTQMLRLEGDAYQSASERLQVVRDQVDAYREMIQQAAEAGQVDTTRAANLDNLQASLASKYDIASSQAYQRSMQQEASELLRLYTQLLDITQRIRLAGDDATAGMVLQRQQIMEAYLAQEQVVESYRDTADGAAVWADYLQRIEELTGRYAQNTETQELVREQEKLNALRLEEVQLAYQAKGGASEELELVSRKAAAQQAVVDQMAAQYGRSEAFLAAQRNSIAQVTRELEKQAQVTAQMQDAENRKSEQALYSFNVSELQQAYKDIISSTTQLWSIQEKMKTASSAELPYLQQIEASLQNRLTLSQNVFARLKDYPEAIQLQGKLTDELAVKQAEYNLQLLKSKGHADGLAHTLEHMAGNLLADVVRGFAREIANAFREAAVYVEEYNSLLTEISIVTGRTQAEVEALGSSYRQLAKDMKVTSTQIAEAAVGYYRQGLNDTQVMERLGKTIQFSKTSGLEFADAAEYLTATVNSMDVTIERAADVFNYLGDATATGADEVAVAFSKVGGAAKTADLEFEKVASWIAVISSRTREAAEVIGSSLNSILARYRNIKAAGFVQNDDGSTTVTNDVVAALGSAGINAIDESTGQLRNYGDILDELAPKWKTLDSNTQAYLGTVMAGTRMQSRFFNLMENYEESLELYNEALDATGTTSQKYAQWSESVAAAHERMNASVEALYANLVSSDALKAYYNLMASLADLLGIAVGELDLWKLSLGLIAAAVVAAMSMTRISFRDLNAEMIKTMALRVVDWFKSLITSSSKASIAIRGLGAAFKASLAFLAVSLIVSAVQAIASAGDESERAARKIEQMNDALSDISDRRTRLDALQSELESLQQKAVLSQTDFSRLVEIKAELAALSPELAAKYQAEGQSMTTLSGLARDAASAYQELSEEERKAKAGARSAYYDQTDDMFYTWGQWGKTDYENAVINRDDAQWYYDNAVQGYRNYLAMVQSYDPETRAMIEASDEHKEMIAEYETLIAEMAQNLSSAQDELDAQLIAINKVYQEGAVAHMKAALDGIEDADTRRRELAYQALDNAQAYASSLRDTLADITEAKDDMAKGIFDASQYEDLIEVMDEYGFDLLSVLGGEDGIEEAMDMMDDFFALYHAHLTETGEHLGIIAEDWDTVQAKQEEARQAAESGYMEQLQQLIDTGSLSFDNSAVTEGFLNAYPAIAACIDATGKFRGNVGDLRKELGKLSFKKFSAASDDIESLQEALQGIRKGKSAVDVVSGLAESYQEELIPALQNREALEELITQQINDQAIEQQYALWQMAGNTGSFINYCATAYPQLYNALAQVYGQDVQNFQTFGQAKAAIDAAVRQAIGDSWDGVYASGIAQMDKAAAQLEAAGQSAAASRYRAIANAMRAINNTRVSAGGGIKIPSVSSSGGGGGSSSSSSKQQTAADKLIDKMSNTDDYVDAQRTILQLQQAYHEARNETEAVLHYMQQEYDLIKDLPEQYRQNMKEIKAMLDAKKAELAATSTSADNYETLANDVQNLEAAYSQYQQQMIETETELLELTEAMEEQRNAVRDTTIEVQDLIAQAIEDRNAREEEALEARIDMEDEIIAALQKRYEAERDLQKEALDERKAALQEEKQALTDALNDRKKLKEEQSKAEQLALMEANYAVISRDATRAKEAAALYEDIQELRDEIAEDQLSKQIEEQQKLLDEQIAAIEEELAELDEAYEEHSTPADLAAEVAEILSMTDEQIIEWLKAHSEDFAASTAATQEAMIAGWQETLNAMNGIQEINWAEVEQIMAGGQEAIIQFLRENLDDYRLASKEQAEAYEEEWVKVLDRLKAQMQSFQETATLNPGEVLQPTVIQPSTSSGSSGGSGGKTSSSGGGKKNNTTSSSTSSTSLAGLLAGAAATITGAIAGATVAGTVGSVIGAATAVIGSAIANSVKPVTSITNTISNLFGGNTNKKSSSSTTNNSVNVNVNASTVKSTANTIKNVVKKNGITMTLK